MEDTARYNTAIHEAGHAVIGTLVGLTVIELTVDPGEDYLGLTKFDQIYSDEAFQIVNHPDFMLDTVLEELLPPDYHPNIEIESCSLLGGRIPRLRRRVLPPDLFY